MVVIILYPNRLSIFLLCLAMVGILFQPAALAQSTQDGEPSEAEDSEGIDEARARRLRLRGIILTVIGLSMTGGGATMAAFGFDEQRDLDGSVLRPLAIVFMGVGLALSGVGIADMIVGLSARSRDDSDDDEPDDEESALRLHTPRNFALAPLESFVPSVPSLTVRRLYGYWFECCDQTRQSASYHHARAFRLWVLRAPAGPR